MAEQLVDVQGRAPLLAPTGVFASEDVAHLEQLAAGVRREFCRLTVPLHVVCLLDGRQLLDMHQLSGCQGDDDDPVLCLILVGEQE